MARLLVDENLPLPVVTELRKLGHDVQTLSELGLADQALPDDEVLRVAVDDGRAVVTLNRRHFVALHRTIAEHAGIVVCSFDPDFPRQAARIHDEITRSSGLANQLLRVNRPSL